MIDELEHAILELEGCEAFAIAKFSIDNIENLLNEISLLKTRIETELA